MFTASVSCSSWSIFVLFPPHSQPVMVCRQCPGYKADVSPLLFPPASSWLLPALPEGGAKAAGEQPSTSSDVASGDGEHHHPKFSLTHAVGVLKMAPTTRPNVCVVPFSNTRFCSSFVCSASGVPLPPPGLPPHLHLLPPADAGPAGRAQRPAGRSAM